MDDTLTKYYKCKELGCENSCKNMKEAREEFWI